MSSAIDAYSAINTRLHLHRCSHLGTVAATVASASYAQAMLELAESAKAVGFPCLAVQPYDDFEELHASDVILPLPLPERPLLPRSIWCSSEFTGARSPGGQAVNNGWYGWRRSHLYRVLMWVQIISRGFHLLAVDLDWRFRANLRLPEIMGLTAIDGTPLDVFNWWDGPHERTVNVGLMWIRASLSALALVRKVQNRTFAAWEQGVFNEELQHRYTNLSCCHCNSLANTWFNRSWKDHKGKATASHVAARFEREGQPRCAADDELPPGDSPPNASNWNWNVSGWLPNSYNWIARRYYGRCTGAVDCTCSVRTAGGVKRLTANKRSIDDFKAAVAPKNAGASEFRESNHTELLTRGD